MTIEEKAEEYTNKNFNTYNNKGADIFHAYIAGAKENQPNTEEMLKRLSKAGIITNLFTWHDLRKDPNDLPKEAGNYIVRYLDDMNKIHFDIKQNVVYS